MEREQAEAHQAAVKEKLKAARESQAAKQKESRLLEQNRRQTGCAETCFPVTLVSRITLAVVCKDWFVQ